MKRAPSFVPSRQGVKGFTLLEVMIAAGIGLIVILGITTVLANQLRHTAFLEDKMSRIQLEKDFDTYLEDQAVCDKSLNLTALAATPQPFVLRDKDGNVIFDLATKNSFDHLKIVGMTVVNKDITGFNQTGFVEVNVSVESKREVLGPRGPFTFKITRMVTSQALAMNIASCASASGGAVVSTGNIDTYSTCYKCTTPIVATGKYTMCWIGRISNLENSHRCKVYLDTDGLWKMTQYKSGCEMRCLKAE